MLVFGPRSSAASYWGASEHLLMWGRWSAVRPGPVEAAMEKDVHSMCSVQCALGGYIVFVKK
jgi:hypothetical protein